MGDADEIYRVQRGASFHVWPTGSSGRDRAECCPSYAVEDNGFRILCIQGYGMGTRKPKSPGKSLYRGCRGCGVFNDGRDNNRISIVPVTCGLCSWIPHSLSQG